MIPKVALGPLITTWVTFTPCFLWVFLGGPHIEQLRGNKRIGMPLSAVTAAVVGVVLYLAVWFALNVVRPHTGFDWFAILLGGAALIAMLRWKSFALFQKKTIAPTGFNRKRGPSRYRQIASGSSVRSPADPSTASAAERQMGGPGQKTKARADARAFFIVHRGGPRRPTRPTPSPPAAMDSISRSMASLPSARPPPSARRGRRGRSAPRTYGFWLVTRAALRAGPPCRRF